MPASIEPGMRCLASCGGPWGHGTIRRVNEDGTFDLTLDDEALSLHPLWQGVTRSEVSIDDEARWPAVFSRIAPSGVLRHADFAAALAATGAAVETERLAGFWRREVAQLARVDEDAAAHATLGSPDAYRLVRRAGFATQAFELDPRAPQPFYWNQTRMGGRAPSEIARPVTLADAYAALGIADVVDAKAVGRLEALETKLGVLVPETLRALATRRDIEATFHDAHPNEPSLLPIDAWTRIPFEGTDFLAFVEPHQGDHVWAVALAADGRPADGRVMVLVLDDDDEAKVVASRHVADGVAFFVWDLAQTGLVWFQTTKFEGGRPYRRTDIGIARVR